MTPFCLNRSEKEMEKEYLAVLREKTQGQVDLLLKNCGGMELAFEGPGMLGLFLNPLTSLSFPEYPVDRQEGLVRYSMTLEVVAFSLVFDLPESRFSQDQIFAMAYLSSLYLHFSKSSLYPWFDTVYCMAIIAKAASLSDFKTTLVFARYWYSFLISACKSPGYFWQKSPCQIADLVIALLHVILLHGPEPSGDPSLEPEALREDLRFKEFLLSFYGEGLLQDPSKAQVMEYIQFLSGKVRTIAFQGKR